MIDPGFGFGKNLDHNLRLLAELEERDAHDKAEREEWIAGLHAEIETLKQQLAEMRSRRAWRLIEKLDALRRRLRG